MRIVAYFVVCGLCVSACSETSPSVTANGGTNAATGGEAGTGGSSSAGTNSATGGAATGGTSGGGAMAASGGAVGEATGGTSSGGTTAARGGTATSEATGGTSSGSTTAATGGATVTGGSSGLPYCGENGGGWGAHVRASAGAVSLSPYNGNAVVTAVSVPSDMPAPWAERSLTLTLADGSAAEVSFAMSNNEPPALDALVGKHVVAVVSPDTNAGYMGGGELTLRDDNGLILSVKWAMGGMSAIPTSIAGIDVNIGPAVCVNRCGGLIHTLQFAATSSVELAEGEHGTLQSGSSTYAAYAMICADKCTSGAADGYAATSFGIFRNGL